jgi:hypothetical protein
MWESAHHGSVQELMETIVDDVARTQGANCVDFYLLITQRGERERQGLGYKSKTPLGYFMQKRNSLANY